MAKVQYNWNYINNNKRFQEIRRQDQKIEKALNNLVKSVEASTAKTSKAIEAEDNLFIQNLLSDVGIKF